MNSTEGQWRSTESITSKGQVGKVIPQPDGKLLVRGVDLIDNRQILKEADMVVLAAAIEPNPDVRKIATMLTASIDTNNFLTEAHAEAASGRVSDCRHLPLRRVPGTEGYPGDGFTGRCGGRKGHRTAGKRQTDDESVYGAGRTSFYATAVRQCANVCPYGAISYEEKAGQTITVSVKSGVSHR